MKTVERVLDLISDMSQEELDELWVGLSRRNIHAGITPYMAFCTANDQGGSNFLRRIACGDSAWACQYALQVDKKPMSSTRQAASRIPEYAFNYALQVDKKPHLVTWAGVQGSELESVYRAVVGAWSILDRERTIFLLANCGQELAGSLANRPEKGLHPLVDAEYSVLEALLLEIEKALGMPPPQSAGMPVEKEVLEKDHESLTNAIDADLFHGNTSKMEH